ncbi:MAG: S8 family serine peptidase, partial [Bacteroidetes bacterium]|nr:S8 family serine peptidase [Bacteroidota bacterium]
DIISAVGAELKGFNFGKVFNVPIPEGEDYEDMVTDLQGLDEVGYANAVFPPIPGTWPNDDHYPQPSQENDVNNWVTIQANLHSTTYTMANHSCMDINMQPAFDEYQGSPEIRLGILDSGVDFSHEELDGRDLNGSDLFRTISHGTAVASVMMANSNNDSGIAGIEWEAGLFSRQVSGNVPAKIREIYHADYDGDCDVINISYSFNSYNWSIAVAEAHTYGRIVCLLTGNENQFQDNITIAHTHPGIISVGATGPEGLRAIPFDWGSGGSNHGTYVDVVAPGTSIKAAQAGGGYTWPNGTSVATPQVAGLAGFLLGYSRGVYSGTAALTNEDIRGLICATAQGVRNYNVDFSTALGDHCTELGYGMVDAGKAIERLKDPWVIVHYPMPNNQLITGCDSCVNDYTGQMYFDHEFDTDETENCPEGNYIVEKYSVTKLARLEIDGDMPKAWGRGNDLRDGDPSPTGVHPVNFYPSNWIGAESVDVDGVVLKTYVYKVWNTNNGFQGWFPCEPVDLNWKFSLMYNTENTDVPDMDKEVAFVPTSSSISAHPNPFNGKVTIDYRVHTRADANISIYDTQGRLIQNLIKGRLQPGEYKVTWDATHSPSGIYIAKFTMGEIVMSQKLFLLK